MTIITRTHRVEGVQSLEHESERVVVSDDVTYSTVNLGRHVERDYPSKESAMTFPKSNADGTHKPINASNMQYRHRKKNAAWGL